MKQKAIKSKMEESFPTPFSLTCGMEIWRITIPNF